MRRVLQAAVLVGALVLTSGCGLVDRAGAAVIVEGQRYTDEQLGADFVAITKALGKQDAPGTMDDINRNFISIFIADAVTKIAAEQQGVEIDKAAVGKLRRSIEKQLGGEQQLEAYAASKGIAPSMLWTVLRNSVLTTDIGAKLIGGTNTDDQYAAAQKYILALAKTLDVEVSPRYGDWDPSQMAAVAGGNDLSTAVGATTA